MRFAEAMGGPVTTRAQVRALLLARGEEQAALFAAADTLRRERKGDAVPLRGILEISNVCARDCAYCGIRAGNPGVERYTMTEDGILAEARRFRERGYGTVVLQGGEVPGPGDAGLAALLRRLKAETDLAVTVSLGVRPREVYAAWRDAGMDRYLLRFETADPALYASLHPDSTLAQRLAALADLRALGVETGSGFLIGVPGETVDVLAANIMLCRELDLDMVGSGPFIAHPDTPLGGARNAWADDPDMFFRAIATLRLALPEANIPATTAFDAVFPGTGRDLVLRRGANVFMPNATPPAYRGRYQLYPDKPCLGESADECAACVALRLAALGREIAP